MSPLNKRTVTLFGVLVFACVGVSSENYGVFKSADLGRSWDRSDTGLPNDSRVNAFGASGETLFAGTDSGVFVSRDEARSWQPAKMAAMFPCRVLCFASFGRMVVAGTDGDGILLSADGGNTWARCGTFPFKKVRCLLAHREKVFAGTDTDGVFVSGDGGETWSSLERGFPVHAQVFALAIAKDTLFAGLYGKGLYAWTDRQQPQWEKTGHVSPLVLTTIDGTLIAGHNPGGLHWSENMGVTWSQGRSVVPDAPGELSSEAPVWELASNGELAIAGASDGIFCSLDGGRTWTRARTGLPDKCPGISFLLNGTYILAGISIDRAQCTTDGPAKAGVSVHTDAGSIRWVPGSGR